MQHELDTSPYGYYDRFIAPVHRDAFLAPSSSANASGAAHHHQRGVFSSSSLSPLLPMGGNTFHHATTAINGSRGGAAHSTSTQLNASGSTAGPNTTVDDEDDVPSPYRAALQERLRLVPPETVFAWPIRSSTPQPQRCSTPQPMHLLDGSPGQHLPTPCLSDPSPQEYFNYDGCHTPRNQSGNYSGNHSAAGSHGSPTPHHLGSLVDDFHRAAVSGEQSPTSAPLRSYSGGVAAAASTKISSIFSPLSSFGAVGVRSVSPAPPATPPPSRRNNTSPAPSTRSPYVGGTHGSDPISPAPIDIDDMPPSMVAFRSPTPSRQSSFHYASSGSVHHHHPHHYQLLPITGSAPARILDADGLSGDVLAQTVAWGPYPNTVVIALRSVAYLWDPDAGVTVIHQGPCDVSSVACSAEPRPTVAIGLANGLVHQYFLTRDGRGPSVVETNTDLTARVASLAFAVEANGENVLMTGSDDGALLWLRVKNFTVLRRTCLRDGISAIAVSPQHSHVAVTTKKKGIVVFHASNMTQPTFLEAQVEHPHRPVAWVPHQTVGTLSFADGISGSVVRIVSLGSGEVCSRDTGARILQMVWSALTQDLVVTFDRHHDAAFSCCLAFYSWNLDRLRSVRSVASHSAPPTHLALSADGTTLLTGAAEEDCTLRFWRAFSKNVATSTSPQSGNSPIMPSRSSSHNAASEARSAAQSRLDHLVEQFGILDFDDELR